MIDIKRLLKYRGLSANTCALYIDSTGISLVLTSNEPRQTPITIDKHVFFPFDKEPSFESLSSLLTSLAKTYQLNHAQCIYVLSHNLYRLLLIDIPNKVRDEDLKASASWLVNDLIDFPESNLITDIFLTPTANPKERKAYVCIVKRDQLMLRQQQLISSDIPLKAMTISDLTLTYLVRHQSTAGNTVILDLSEPYGNMLILKEQNLALTHEIDLKPMTSGILSAENIKPLIDDIQRTIQFYLSTQHSDQAVKIILLPTIAEHSALLAVLSQELTYTFEPLNIDNQFTFTQDVDAQTMSQLIYVLGALLTPNEAS